MADYDNESHVNSKDLAHSPEVKFSASLEAVIGLRLEVGDLHEGQQSDVEQDIYAHSVLIADLCLEAAEVEQTDKQVGSVQTHDKVLGHQQRSALLRIAVDNQIRAD